MEIFVIDGFETDLVYGCFVLSCNGRNVYLNSKIWVQIEPAIAPGKRKNGQ
jgi:hypothetical protein